MRRSILCSLAGAALVVVLSACQPPPDETTVVGTFVDSVDVDPGDGVCADADGSCSLRAAVMESNADADIDEILLPAGTYTLNIVGWGEDAAATGDLDLVASTYIRSIGGVATINGSGLGNDRIFHTLGSANYALDGLEIRNGEAHPHEDGGGLLHTGGVMTVRAQFLGNRAENGAGISATGGVLNIYDSTFAFNRAEVVDIYTPVQPVGRGAAVLNDGAAVVVENSTFYQSSSRDGHDLGAAIESASGSTSVRFSTIADNESNGLGGDVTLGSSVLAENDSNCVGGPSSIGAVVSDDATCGFDPTGTNLEVADAGIGDQVFRPGSFRFLEVAAGSPVLDLIAPGTHGCGDERPATMGDFRFDQNGVARPVHGACDAGAIEATGCSLYGGFALTSISQDECDALLAFEDALDMAIPPIGPGGIPIHAGWGTVTDPCSWFGVLCRDGGVSELVFAGWAYNGQLPPELADLIHLERLVVQGGLFEPHISGSIPPELGNLANLVELDLFGNNLTGTLPASFASLSSLQRLHVGQNALGGDVTAALAPFTGSSALIHLADGPGYNNCFTTTDAALAAWLDAQPSTHPWDECEAP